MTNRGNRCMHLILNLVLCHLIALVHVIDGADYSGYRLYEATPSSREHDVVLERLKRSEYDNWKHSRGNATSFLIPPELRGDFEQTMKEAGISTRIVLEDVNRGLEAEKDANERAKRATEERPEDFDFDRFPRYNEIVQFMYQLVNGSKYASMVNIGRSFEGRSILGIQVKGSSENPVLFVDAGMHAREWAAPVTAMYIMKKIVEFENILADRLTIYVIPVVNPDGYEFTHTDDRFWRKSRSTNTNTTCIGVDINRNFDSYWGVYGADKHPCSRTFPGFAPFSEPEAIAIKDSILAVRPSLYLTLHSFGQLLLYPYGFTRSLPENWRELHNLAHDAAAVLKRVNGQDYRIGSSTNVLYLASGGSDDWAKEKAHVPLVYTMELPNYGEGFVVPVEKIKPMVTETFAAFLVFAKYVCSKHHGTNC